MILGRWYILVGGGARVWCYAAKGEELYMFFDGEGMVMYTYHPKVKDEIVGVEW